MPAVEDKWSTWLRETRFGGDAEAAERGMRMLYRVRDDVLEAARIRDGDTVLDIGCGDGLIAFGALDRVGERGTVIFSDISEALLEGCRAAATAIGAIERCRFVTAAADDLAEIGDASVDVVTTRSVLIYVVEKASAFSEFFRVLGPGGRISLWEPINRFEVTYGGSPDGMAKAAPEIADLLGRLQDRVRALHPDDHPMMDFDQHDLLRYAEAAGFPAVHLAYHVVVMPAQRVRWETWLNSAGNPTVPPTGEIAAAIFSAEEMARFERHARPVLERGGYPFRTASAMLTATKAGGP